MKKLSLSDLHAELCNEGFHYDGRPILDCSVDEEDANEVGVCAIWDALRDAYELGVADAEFNYMSMSTR